jgi:metal-responsive CopG/Arc/MetJ family transcriptional regulator
MTETRIRTTVAIESGLLKAVDRAVQGGRASSRNQFLDRALRKELRRTDRAAIDAAFAAMADDASYRDQAEAIAEEFRQADWEALKSVEGEA